MPSIHEVLSLSPLSYVYSEREKWVRWFECDITSDRMVTRGNGGGGSVMTCSTIHDASGPLDIPILTVEIIVDGSHSLKAAKVLERISLNQKTLLVNTPYWSRVMVPTSVVGPSFKVGRKLASFRIEGMVVE